MVIVYIFSDFFEKSQQKKRKPLSYAQLYSATFSPTYSNSVSCAKP